MHGAMALAAAAFFLCCTPLRISKSSEGCYDAKTIEDLVVTYTSYKNIMKKCINPSIRVGINLPKIPNFVRFDFSTRPLSAGAELQLCSSGDGGR